MVRLVEDVLLVSLADPGSEFLRIAGDLIKVVEAWPRETAAGRVQSQLQLQIYLGHLVEDLRSRGRRNRNGCS
jgi:hypothetical protein